jgi:hypothetical protein
VAVQDIDLIFLFCTRASVFWCECERIEGLADVSIEMKTIIGVLIRTGSVDLTPE